MFHWQRIKENFPHLVTDYDGPTKGNFIWLTEICYNKPIPVDCFSRILVACQKCSLLSMMEWRNQEPANTLQRIAATCIHKVLS